MFDQQKYIESKIFSSLNNSDLYDKKYEAAITKLFNLIVDKVNLMPVKGEDWENSIVSWLQFKNIILELIENNKEINISNFKTNYNTSVLEKREVKSVTRDDIIDESLLIEEAPETKLQRLLELADEMDVDESFDVSELSENGLRSTDLINTDETSLDGFELQIKESVPTVYVSSKKDFSIVSPFTGTTNVYRIDSNFWGDMDTGQHFKVSFTEEED